MIEAWPHPTFCKVVCDGVHFCYPGLVSSFWASYLSLMWELERETPKLHSIYILSLNIIHSVREIIYNVHFLASPGRSPKCHSRNQCALTLQWDQTEIPQKYYFFLRIETLDLWWHCLTLGNEKHLNWVLLQGRSKRKNNLIRSSYIEQIDVTQRQNLNILMPILRRIWNKRQMVK